MFIKCMLVDCLSNKKRLKVLQSSNQQKAITSQRSLIRHHLIRLIVNKI